MQIAGYNVANFLRDSVADRLNNVGAREVNVSVVDETHVDAFFTTQAGARFGYRMTIQPDTVDKARVASTSGHPVQSQPGDRVTQPAPETTPPPATQTSFDVLVEIRDLMVANNAKLDEIIDEL